MYRSMNTAVAAIAVLLATQGPLLAQEPPAAGQAPQATPSVPDRDEGGSGWWDWHGWMMGDDDDGGARGRMSWRGQGGPGMMWGGGMPMHSGMMPMMMMVMMDTDGSDSISYEEVEAVHRRMFNMVDRDKNGQLSPEEVQAVMGMHFGKRDD